MRRLNQKGSSLMELVVTLAILSIIFTTYLYFTGNMFDQVENMEGKTEVRNMTNIIAESIFHNPQQFQAHFKKEDLSTETKKKDFLNTTLAYDKLDDQRFNTEGFCDKTTCPNAKGRFAFLIIPVSDGSISLYEKDESGNDITKDGTKDIDPNVSLTTTGMMRIYVRVYQNEKVYKDFESIVSGSGL